MSMLEFTSEAELRAHYIAVRARRDAYRAPVKPAPLPPVIVTTNSRKPWIPPTVTICDILPPPRARDRIGDIQRLVCARFNISVAEIISECRDKRLTWPRQIAMYLCVTWGARSQGVTAQRFGGRDHSTCSHARDKVAAQRLTDPELDATLKELEAELQT